MNSWGLYQINIRGGVVVENGKISQALCDVMKEIKPVEKNEQGQGLNYKFRSIYGILNMIQPILAKYEVYIKPKVLEKTSSVNEIEKEYYDKDAKGYKSKKSFESHVDVMVEYAFTTSDRSHEDVVVAGEGVDYGDKALNKAMTSALKNALQQMFAIPTDDMSDSEYEDVELKSNPEKQKEKPKSEPQQKPKEKADAGQAEKPTADEYIKRIEACKNVFEIKAWGEKHSEEIKTLPETDLVRVREVFGVRKDILQKDHDLDKLSQLTKKEKGVIKAYLDEGDLWGGDMLTKALKGNPDAITALDKALDDYIADKSATDLLGDGGKEYNMPA